VKDEIRSLRTQLQVRERAEISLRHDLDEAVKKYDQAILDLQTSQREKNDLQEQVERLRKELKQEREARSELEGDIERRIRREFHLLDILERTSKISQTRIEESMLATERRIREAEEADQERPARSARTEAPRRGGRQRRRTSQTIINIHGRSESSVKWVPFFKNG
jgi:chromosome segregation ATPase